MDSHTLSVYMDSERSKNIFTPYYVHPVLKKKNNPKEVLSTVQKAFRNYSHEDALEFAATSHSWKNLSADDYLTLSRHRKTLTNFSDGLGVRAYYRVISKKPNSYILTACHVNIHGHHRGDLRFIEVNDRTTASGYSFCSLVGMLYLGDILVIAKLALLKPFENIDVFQSSQDSHCIWMATDVAILPRNILKGVTFSVLENGTAVVKEQNEVMNVELDPRFRGGLEPLQPGKLYTGDAFLPERLTFFFTEELRSEHKNGIIAKCSKIHQYPNPLGTIFDYEESPDLSRLFEIGVDAFKPDSHYLSPESVLETCVLMGYAAAVSISNGRFDARPFPMHGTERKGQIVKFCIDNPVDNPTYGKWAINNRIRFKGPPSKDDMSKRSEVNAVIETVIIDQKSKKLKISARLSRDVPQFIKFDRGIHIVYQREALEAQVLKKGFFSDTPPGSNGQRIIKALYGGSSIPSKYYISQRPYYYPAFPIRIKLNEFQCDYVDMLLCGNPIVVGSSPFGCGKSMTIVTAALEIDKRNQKRYSLTPDKKPKQLLVTQSNYASVNLVEIAQKTHGFKFVRYVSEKNYKELPEDCLTQFDLPVLMKRQFILWAFGKDQSVLLETRHTTNMISYLLAEKILTHEDFSGQAHRVFHCGFKKKTPWFYDLLEAFLILYDPDVIMTTADSLQGLLSAETFKKIPISTVQIDEASQVPEYTFISLLTSFPKACFGLIGDIQQLPPYCETGLEGKLKDYGIGNTMERAVEENLFPQAMLREVYRCHPKTTDLLGKLFYDGRLISGISADQRSNFMNSRPDFWPNPNFPIMIVNNNARGQKMGTSYSNRQEKDTVKQILDSLITSTLHPSGIGVISFYSAQTSVLTEALRGRGVKCGTVDAFQGSEKEVIILCCTNDRISEFMQLKNRLNVAMSRAKQVTIIVGNVEGLIKAKHWSHIVRKVLEHECVIDTKHIGKLRDVPNQPTGGRGHSGNSRRRNSRNRNQQHAPVIPAAVVPAAVVPQAMVPAAAVVVAEVSAIVPIVPATVPAVPTAPTPAAGTQNDQAAQPNEEEDLADQVDAMSLATLPTSTTDLIASLRLEKQLKEVQKALEAANAKNAALKAENERIKEVEWNMCDICLLGYKQDTPDNTPKILDCGHTFCQLCCSKMAQNNSIPCPTCRKPTTGRADQLKTNFGIYQHL